MNNATRYTGEIARLEAGLLARGIDVNGPVDTAPVTIALKTIDSLMATIKGLLPEQDLDSAFPEYNPGDPPGVYAASPEQARQIRDAQMERFLDMHGHTPNRKS